MAGAVALEALFALAVEASVARADPAAPLRALAREMAGPVALVAHA